ncbi:hypothetical protein [Nocardia puris]|uniref:hypothetical protein n=1 Tax=Nocardia puris TaxID=208602 RepID=UPI001E5447B6|nr:hypothetical protein [Nocardia puris]
MQELRYQNENLGPILHHPRSDRWSFLVRPDIPDDVGLFAELFRANVSVVREGGTIALPSPADPHENFRRWILPPRCALRPSGLVVVAAVRACPPTGNRP